MKSVKRKRNTSSDEIHETSDTAVRSSTNESESIMNWSKNDKKVLLKALKKYGSEDIQAISNMLPMIPPSEIELKILEYSKIASDIVNTEYLDNWLKLYQPGDSMVPQALLFISLFEEHPPPSELEGHDIRAIYRFLYRSCYGKASLFGLSQKDRDLLLILLMKIQQKIWPWCKPELLQYANGVCNAKEERRVYPGKNRQQSTTKDVASGSTRASATC